MAKLDRVVHAFARVLQALRRALLFLFGRLSWEPPLWIRAVGRGVRGVGGAMVRHPGRTAAAFVALVLLTGGGVYLRRWYQSLPKPLLVQVAVTAPGLTPLEERRRPQPLFVDFDASAAPLDRIDKVITGGISLSPAIAGTWRWQGDQRLTFVPQKDWPVGQSYELELAKKGLVAAHLRLEQYELTFVSAPFEVSLEKAEFYQDPTDQNLKKVVATFAFSHPVDPPSFEKRLGMRLVPSDKEDPPRRPQFRVTYDKLKGHAFVHSDPLEPRRKDATLELSLSEGSRAAAGGPAVSRALEAKVRVPGLYNFLRVAGIRIEVVENERMEPEHVLFVETTVGVTEADVARAVSATLLPLRDENNQVIRSLGPEAVGPELLARGQVIRLAPVPAAREHHTLHGFRLDAPAGRLVHVKVEAGLRGFGGYILGETAQTVARVPAFPRQVKLLHDGALLALGGERKVSVYARDVPGLLIEISRVLPHQIQHLVSHTHGSFARPTFHYALDESHLTERFAEVRTLPALRPGQPQYEAIDLGRYLEGTGVERRGVFLVRVDSYDPVQKRRLGESDRRLVLVSNLGVLAKENEDGSHDVFVQSIQTGLPVGGARVSILGRNGVPVVNRTSDGEGHVHLEKLDRLGPEQAPTLFLVTAGADQSFLPYDRRDRLLDTSRFDVGGVSEDGPTEGLNAYLFSDRGLYRPGEDIRVAMIVKRRDFGQALAGLPLEVVVTDPRGLTVKRQRVRLSAAGFEEIQHTTAEISPTGKYTFGVYVVKDEQADTLLGSTEVEVREFLPDRMKIRVALSTESPEGWVFPAELGARVSLANLFGTPAAGRRVRASLSLRPWAPRFGRFADYTFFDPLRAKEGHQETLPEVTTDDAGDAEIPLGLGRFAAATYHLSLVVEGFEAEGGRSVTAEVSSMVSPLPYLIGYKPDGSLDYINRGSDRGVELIAIDPRGARTEARGLSAVLLERRHVSVLMKQDDGTYRYQSVRKEAERSRAPLAIGRRGRRWTVPTDTPGDFLLSLRDADGQEQQRIFFTVAGQANLSREVEKNAELGLTLKSADVEPGGELEVQIKAPFVGAGLITIERDRVYAWKWFRTETTASVQTIQVPEGLEGGGYLSVAFIRDPASPEVFMSPMGHGVVPFSVSLARRKLGVTLEAPELVKPGAPMALRYRTDRPAKVVLFAVDEGILRVARYKTPDPLGYFFAKRRLGVSTSQILDMILPEYQRLLEALAPGGDGDGALGANLNPFGRKRRPPVACWSGLLDAGPRAQTYDCPIPDHFNGTLRVMTVAVAPDALGAFEGRTLVRGDFVISPNAPTFLAPGDEAEVTVSVTNAVAGTGTGDVRLSLKTSAGLQVLDGTERRLSIPEQREASARFRVRARPPLGSASLSFQARSGKNHSTLTTDLSIRPASPYQTTFAAGHLRKGQVTVPVQRELYPEHRTLEAGISYLPLGLAHGLTGYLERFPHGCTEQVVSQTVPAVALARRPEFGLDPPKATAAVERGIAVLRGRQNADGSFGQWAANPAVDRLASVWATHLLWEARERGFAVPADLLQAAVLHSRQLASADPDSLPEARLQAYATYVLTLNRSATGGLIAAQLQHLEANHKAVWRGDLAGLYLAAASRLLRQDRIVAEVLAAQTLGRDVPPDTDWYHDRLAHDAQMLYLLARHFPERASSLGATDIAAFADPIFNGSYTTYSSAWAILALEAYARVATAATPGQLGAAEMVKGKARAISLSEGLLPRAPFSDAATDIRFSNDGPYDAYYVVAQRGFDQKPTAAALARKIEVFREYTGAGGTPLADVKLGDEIEVHVRLRAQGPRPVGQIAVVDLLPGGFEPVLQSDPRVRATGSALPFTTPASTFAASYGEAREDRVVVYGTALPEAKKIVYVIKATSAGTFRVPPVLANAMYDRSAMASGVAGTITVQAASPP